VARAKDMGYTMIAAGTDTGIMEAGMKNLVGHIGGGAK
jgi:hypothetical protein